MVKGGITDEIEYLNLNTLILDRSGVSNNMRNLLTLRNLLRTLTLAAWIVALLWFFSDGTYEPLLALITGTATLIASFAVSDNKVGVRMKNVKAGRNIETTDETGGGVDMNTVEAGQDIITSEKQRK